MKKICSSCGEELLLTGFNKKASARDGHQSYCRECSHRHWAQSYPKDIRRARHAEQRARIIAYIAYYTSQCVCAKCHTARATHLAPDHLLAQIVSKKYSPETAKVLLDSKATAFCPSHGAGLC